MGGAPQNDVIAQLQEQIKALQLENDAKDTENRNLQALIDRSPDDSEISDNALRKRLNRLCERKKNGWLATQSHYAVMKHVRIQKRKMAAKELADPTRDS